MPQNTIQLLHFNDCYNIEPATREPVGGAARFVAEVKRRVLAEADAPLVVFSGDIYNPSLLSTITKGKQMPAILNAACVAVSCIGNHDLDYGIPNFEALAADCSFPWLCTNALDAATGKPLGGCATHVLLPHAGLQVGFLGLIEPEWLGSIAAVDAEEVTYIPFETAAKEYVAKLRKMGADVVIALTHMRWPSDEALAAAATGVDLILGGHDHDVGRRLVNGTWIVKSGTDFRMLTCIEMTLPGGDEGGVQCSFEQVGITGDCPEDPTIAEHVHSYMRSMEASMALPLGYTAVDLDGRFDIVRRQESNLGNLVCDVWRLAARADVALLNSGTLRSDRVHPKGQLCMGDMFAILPMIDGTVVIQATGAQIIAALENGVSKWPALEGRFPQVSGVKFAFDGTQPPGQRVHPSSVVLTDSGVALEPDGCYRLATKAYLAEGKDGYDCLEHCPVLVDVDAAPILPTVIRNYFTTLGVLNEISHNKNMLRRWKYQTDRVLHRQQTTTDRGLAVNSVQGWGHSAAPEVEGRIRVLTQALEA